MNEIITVSNLCKQYDKTKKMAVNAVEDVTFQVEKGEWFSIVGESGSGKSTLAKVMVGIETSTQGSVIVEGNEITSLKEKELRMARKKMQLVFQNPRDSISPRMKIGQFLCEPYLNYRIAKRKEAERKAVALLERVNLCASYMNRYPHQISGGELQRVVIARALALQPSVVVCDEITSALDVSTQYEIMELLQQLQREEGLTIVFISHDLGVVTTYSDRVLVMKHGAVVEVLPGDNFRQCATHPYTKTLIASVFSLDQRVYSKINPGA